MVYVVEAQVPQFQDHMFLHWHCSRLANAGTSDPDDTG